MKNQVYNLLMLAAFWGGILGQGQTVENCPKSCHCEIVKWSLPNDTLDVRDCVTDPRNELYNLLHLHKYIWGLKIINASLSGIGDILYLENLQYLNLNYNNFTSLPCELSKLADLYELHLSHNGIRTVDCNMSQLVELRFLHLDYNNLTLLPCELSTIPKLLRLNLSNNHIDTIECGMSQLGELVQLDLGNNKLQSLPCELSTIPKLWRLNLSNNAIQTVDCNMSQLVKLGELYLDNNNLKSVPCQVSQLPVLNWLYLSNNDIETVDCTFLEFKELQHLNLSHNVLATLPPFKGIQRVDVSNNAVTYFTNQAGLNLSCEDLPNYHLQNNNITHLIDVILGWGLPISETNELSVCINKLTELFAGNPLICDCKDYVFYHFLQINVKVWSNPCSSPSSLKGQNPVSIPLDQFICELTDKCPVGCSCVSVPGAQALKVSCEAYTREVLPKDMPDLQNGIFYEIYFRESHLTSLTFRPYFLNTAKAILSHNHITEITMDALKAFARNIKVLHLNHNKLQSLPGMITEIKFLSLVELRLDNNPWHCDCQALALRDFVMMKYTLTKNADSIRCHSPTEVVNIKVTDLARSYFCHSDNGKNTFSITVIAISCILLPVVAATICILKHKKVMEGVRVNVHQQNGGGAEDERDDEGKEFDIFMSYATDDEEYAGEWLIPELERRGFKVCFHRVHFLGGESILVNMFECINKSKRMLAFFSKNFLESNYSMYEFDLALSLDIDGGTKRLVTIKEAPLDIKTLEPSYESYFRTHTYIEQGAVNFWENLLVTMPQKKMGVIADDYAA